MSQRVWWSILEEGGAESFLWALWKNDDSTLRLYEVWPPFPVTGIHCNCCTMSENLAIAQPEEWFNFALEHTSVD